MATHTHPLRMAGLLAILSVSVVSVPVRAAGTERIRPQSSLLRAAVSTGVDRSPTFRMLVDRIEQSDVIVHLTCDRFDTSTLRGRTVLTAANASVRYVRVQILCQQSLETLVSIVAHELRHVVEIASTPGVVDDRSLARLFVAIGFTTCPWAVREQFETIEALRVGEAVRRELMRPEVRLSSGATGR